MSPASSGTLEVERYIGACLISQNRSKVVVGPGKPIVGRGDQYYGRGGDHFLPDIYHGNYVNLDNRFRLQRCNSSVEGWAGGVPLISFANHQRRGKRLDNDIRCSSPRFDDQHNHSHSPLARLAVHTQGAPLILTKQYKKNKQPKNNTTKNGDNTSNNCHSNKNVGGGSKDHTKCQDSRNSASSVVDSVSVTSDESSGSTNSENCLPRIIKPRKRRKKDRKPLLGRPPSQDGFSTDSASPEVEPSPGAVNFRPFVPFNFETYQYNNRSSVPEHLPFSKSDNIGIHEHLKQILGDISETPKLHHSFEDIEELDDIKDINGNQSLCQCRYCDPAGQIWDVDGSCYSPFLTSPSENHVFKFPVVTIDQLFAKDSPETSCISHGMSSLSLDQRGRTQGPKSSDVVSKSFPSTMRQSSSDLEVSTEIVTSLNGHRDIEIKFFTTASVDVRLAKENSGENTNSSKFRKPTVVAV